MTYSRSFEPWLRTNLGGKILIYDNGGEYVKSDFIHYYEYLGIHMQHSIPYTPQQNAVVKRKNKSLKEMATCMMESKQFPPNFLVETIKCASYIHNMFPHKQLYGITPFQSWSGNKPDVTHFRIFGPKAWTRIPTEKRKDLEPQSQECLFVGYSKYSKGYNLINLSTQKSFIERSTCSV